MIWWHIWSAASLTLSQRTLSSKTCIPSPCILLSTTLFSVQMSCAFQRILLYSHQDDVGLSWAETKNSHYYCIHNMHCYLLSTTVQMNAVDQHVSTSVFCSFQRILHCSHQGDHSCSGDGDQWGVSGIRAISSQMLFSVLVWQLHS